MRVLLTGTGFIEDNPAKPACAEESEIMAKKIKQKTRKAVAKRFRRTGTGKIRRACAGRGHLMSHKSRKCKRILRKGAVVSDADFDRINQCLPT